MTGGVSGTLTLTTGSWAVSGNWNTSGAGSVFARGTSTVSLTGVGQTVSILNASNGFYNLTVSGTITQSTVIDVSNSLTVSGTLTTGGFNITGGSNLFVPDGGSLAAGASTSTFTNVTMTGAVSVTNSDGTSLTAISIFTAWTIDSDYTWTHSSTVATSTITFTIGGNTSGQRFNVTKDAVNFTNGLVNGSGQIIFTMLGSDPVVDVRLTSPCGGNRYWIGGVGFWGPNGHFAGFFACGEWWCRT